MCKWKNLTCKNLMELCKASRKKKPIDGDEKYIPGFIKNII